MIPPGEALELAKRYWTKVPVDVFSLARDLGLGPKFQRLPDEISGLIKRVNDDQWLVVINEGHHRVRQRFTCAHEIGHFIFHRDLLADGVSDTLAYRADIAELPNPKIQRQQEWQANNFASNLLVPSAWLTAAQAAGWHDPKDLAKQFDVSETVIRIKLGLPLSS